MEAGLNKWLSNSPSGLRSPTLLSQLQQRTQPVFKMPVECKRQSETAKHFLPTAFSKP